MGKLDATLLSWGKGELLFRVHGNAYGSTEFNASSKGDARFSPLRADTGRIIPTLYAGTTLDCALMETVFHDVPFAAGVKLWSKASHVDGKVYSQLRLRRDLVLIDLSAISLRKLGISRKELIESDGTHYEQARQWAIALHQQYPRAEGLVWTSRQADPARALVLFGDRCKAAMMEEVVAASSLLLPDGSAITPVLNLADRIGVLLIP